MGPICFPKRQQGITANRCVRAEKCAVHVTFLTTVTQHLVSQEENLPGNLAQVNLFLNLYPVRIPPGISENSEVFSGYITLFRGD